MEPSPWKNASIVGCIKYFVVAVSKSKMSPSTDIIVLNAMIYSSEDPYVLKVFTNSEADSRDRDMMEFGLVMEDR